MITNTYFILLVLLNVFFILCSNSTSCSLGKTIWKRRIAGILQQPVLQTPKWIYIKEYQHCIWSSTTNTTLTEIIFINFKLEDPFRREFGSISPSCSSLGHVPKLCRLNVPSVRMPPSMERLVKIFSGESQLAWQFHSSKIIPAFFTQHSNI